MDNVKALKAKVDLDPQGSQHKGVKGLFERFVRRFKTVGYLVTIAPLYLLSGIVLGIALWPALALFDWTRGQVEHFPPSLQYLGYGFSIGFGFFVFGFTLATIIPFLNWATRMSPKPNRGTYYSVENVKWFVHNSYLYLVRYTFLEFMTPTPFNLAFYRAMGMKIGEGTHINTTNISDPALIEIGQKTTVGGSATICAHYGQGGFLVLAPVKIGNNVTIGLRASIMGGVEIGDNAKILPHSIVLPKTVIPSGETWGGVPAVKLDLQSKNESASG